MKPSSIFLLAISVLISACSTEPPKDLNESIAYFETQWSPGQLREFQLKDEDQAVAELHSSVGLWIRNNWILGNRNPPLVRYFDSLHFRHPDDISSTILTSLHRKLNNKDIDLQGQIAHYEAYWKPIVECEENLRKEVISMSNRIHPGDTLVLLFPVDESDNQRNAVVHSCPDREWTFDESKDLRVEGIVTRKFDIGGPANPFIDIRIVSMSDENTKILMEEVAPGDTTDFPLSSLTIEWE